MKKQFLEAYESGRQEEAAQQKLHARHNIEDENVIVVEKSNMIKFSVKTISSLLRVAATILILVLATVGLLCLVYPDTREQMVNILRELEGQFARLITNS